MNTAADDNSSFADGTQCGRNNFSARSKNEDCVEQLGRRFIGAARPDRAEATGKILRLGVPRPRECKNLAAFETGHLRCNVGSHAVALADPLAGRLTAPHISAP